ncbi:SDR family NAD(P)-dependent oxidoreductase [Amycolatopsis sp. NPDC004625]|uniref:SDR family NAD(P)-dependent oxidoreductase n=1 Tax=Amycolatopsis sp. NPDC004625 TaxID=3154670 RepID=UPI0033BBF868
MNRDDRLRERYGPAALVTGATSGIGRAIATELARAGFDLVLAARRKPVLQDLAHELTTRHGISVRVLALDLAGDRGAEELLAATAGTDLGLYVAAAGFGTSGAFLDADPAVEREMLRLNCETVLTTSLGFGRRLAGRGRGGLVLMSSLVGFQGMPHAAHYAATKAYVQTLAEALHVELRPHGVDVLAAAPGPTHSGFAGRAGMRMGTALTPETVARGTLSALGRRPTALPGLLTRVLKAALLPLPRRGRVRIMGSVMAGMTGHPR